MTATSTPAGGALTLQRSVLDESDRTLRGTLGLQLAVADALMDGVERGLEVQHRNEEWLRSLAHRQIDLAARSVWMDLSAFDPSHGTVDGLFDVLDAEQRLGRGLAYSGLNDLLGLYDAAWSGYASLLGGADGGD
jgi:hypothetical protein